MFSDEIAVRVSDLSKCYHIYDRPPDRLKQSVLPKLQRLIRKPPRQYYREFWALKDVSFEVKKGESVGIIGRNGSGKSTLLQLICGTLSPTSGSVETNGRVAALLELGAGFNPEFTGRENVYMNGAVLGLSQEEIDARFDDIAAFADIGDFIDQPVKTYSSGMYVRLAFAVSINVDPKILVVDEALAVGDELFQRKCYSRIENIKDSGATILLVTHSATPVAQMCAQALLLDRGVRLYMGNPKFAIESYHRLIFASPNEADTIKGELMSLDSSHELANNLSGQDRDPKALGDWPVAEAKSTACRALHESLQCERFEPGLVPASTIEYESLGARIENVRIENKERQRVNILAPAREYLYCYDVVFSEPAEQVHFGMLIKTTTGIDLGAIGSPPPNQGIVQIKRGDRYSVEFPFINSFSPGTYFINAGCSGVRDETEQFLHRIIDAVAFRVEHPKNNLRYAGPVQISTGEPCKYSVTTLQDGNTTGAGFDEYS